MDGDANVPDDERPLTREERSEIRKMIESERRARWFYSSVRIWLSWIAGASAAVYGVYKAALESGISKKIGGP